MADGVSDYGSGDSGDMQLIMDGGANWMARMTAFLQAKEQAQAMIAKAQIVGEIAAVRDEARVDREKAAKELSDAKAFAEGIVEKANQQADAALAKARADADKIIAAAKDEAAASALRVAASDKEAQERLTQAQAGSERIAAQEAELKAQASALDKRETRLDATKASVEAMKKSYQTFAKKLRDVLSEEPKTGA